MSRANRKPNPYPAHLIARMASHLHVCSVVSTSHKPVTKTETYPVTITKTYYETKTKETNVPTTKYETKTEQKCTTMKCDDKYGCGY